MKKLLLSFAVVFTMFTGMLFAANQAEFEIIPASTSDVWGKVEQVGSEWGKVRDNYKAISQSGHLWLGEQFASGIMNWDTILSYISYLAKFLWQIALLIWAVSLIIFGYKKATEHLKKSGWWKFANIIKWLLIVIFSYVIIRAIWSMFIS